MATSALRHTRYVLGENPLTVVAFTLFVLAMGIVSVLGNSVEDIVYATADAGMGHLGG